MNPKDQPSWTIGGDHCSVLEKSDHPQLSPQPPYSFGNGVKPTAHPVDSVLDEDSSLDTVYESITPGLVESLCSGINGCFAIPDSLDSFHHRVWVVMLGENTLTLWTGRRYGTGTSNCCASDGEC